MAESVLEADVAILADSPELAAFDGSTILITGSTGLIGSLFVKGLLARNDVHDARIRVLALARSERKARKVFGDRVSRDDLRVVIGDTCALPSIDENIDWISHGASITSSARFAKEPVQVAWTELDGMRALLELAREKNVRGMVYLSSLEVYGDVPEEHGVVHEDYCGPLDRFVPRNSYPVAKRMCENLCVAYASEYEVPVKIVRLAQTFGAGVDPADGRVFAYLARCAVNGENIILRTTAQGCRCYCYTTDAVRGIATVLAKGQMANAYNISNPQTYCSVRDMAAMIAREFGEGKVEVVFDIPADTSSYGFAAPSFVKLGSEKAEALGWTPQFDLRDMYARLIESISPAEEAASAAEGAR